MNKHEDLDIAILTALLNCEFNILPYIFAMILKESLTDNTIRVETCVDGPS